MTWLVIGSQGQLGTDLMAVLGRRAVGLDVPDIDITDLDSVASAVYDVGPEIVVNCAAYTAVDAAETDAVTAQAVNGTGAANVAQAARSARLLHVSTDYVFDGNAARPYAEDAAPSPTSVYGRTKLFGERAVLRHHEAYVVRTAWLYGVHGANFVRTMLELQRSRPEVAVVDDQVGQPTWSMDLARQLVMLGDSEAPTGIYHATNSGQTSWYGLARRIFELSGADPERVRATTTASFPRPAPRPAYSVLGHLGWEQAGLPAMRSWDDALVEALPAIAATLP
jgi:dTDP-4-dehydrorhamnose reductase